MPVLSPWIEKLEKKYESKLKKLWKKIKGKIPILLIGLYFYGVFVNSVRLGIATTFPKPGVPPPPGIWVWNPVLSYAALFRIEALAITAFIVVMFCLINKKGYHFLSGIRLERDPRGFDILQTGAYGTGGWMKPAQMASVLNLGKPEELEGTVLGKLKADPEEDDEDAAYVAMKDRHTLNEHIHVTGNRGSGEAFVTEGGLKGDAASYLSGDRLFICTAGATSIRYLPEVLKSLNVRKVYGCFDMDKAAEYYAAVQRRRDDPDDGAARKLCPLERMEAAVAASGIAYTRCEWPPETNGIDDFYLSQRASQRQAA